MHVCVSEARIKTITGSVDLILDSQHRSLKKKRVRGGGEQKTQLRLKSLSSEQPQANSANNHFFIH